MNGPKSFWQMADSQNKWSSLRLIDRSSESCESTSGERRELLLHSKNILGVTCARTTSSPPISSISCSPCAAQCTYYIPLVVGGTERGKLKKERGSLREKESSRNRVRKLPFGVGKGGEEESSGRVPVLTCWVSSDERPPIDSRSRFFRLVLPPQRPSASIVTVLLWFQILSSNFKIPCPKVTTSAMVAIFCWWSLTGGGLENALENRRIEKVVQIPWIPRVYYW